VAFRINRGVGEHTVVMILQPEAILLAMDVAADRPGLFVGVGIDNWSVGDLAGAVLIPTVHLDSRALDVIIHPMPAGVGVFEDGVKAGVLSFAFFPLIIVEALDLLSVGGAGCDEQQNKGGQLVTSVHLYNGNICQEYVTSYEKNLCTTTAGWRRVGGGLEAGRTDRSIISIFPQNFV